MLIIAGKMQVEPGSRDEVLRSREQMMRESRAEAGCHDYVFSADPIEPGTIYLYERWESKEALAAHIQRLTAAGPDGSPPPISFEVLQYTISETGPIGS